MLRKLLAGVAALGMMATPALARPVAANSAAKLSVVKNVPAGARSASAMKDGSPALGGALTVGLIAGVALIVGIVLITDGDDDPESP